MSSVRCKSTLARSVIDGSKASALSSEPCPTASRMALSLTCTNVSSTLLTWNKYLRGSGLVYCTADLTSTKFVSDVSILESSTTLNCCETLTMRLLSIGQGRCQL